MHQIEAESMRVFYVWNHAHHDEVNDKLFHKHLLRNLHENFIQNKKTTHKISKNSNNWIFHLRDPSNKLPPNPKILTSWPTTIEFLLKIFWKKLKPHSIFPADKMHAHWAPIQSSPYKTSFRSFVLDNDTVTEVICACRPHQIIVTGLIEALILVSMTCALKDMEGFASRTPYDLRLILPYNTAQYPWLQPKKSMCNYVSVVDHEYNEKLVATIRSKMTAESIDSSLSADVMDTVWSVAAQVRRQIQARLDAGVRNDMIAIMKFVSDWRIQQQHEASRTRHFSWLLTNLGVLDRDFADSREQEEGWSLRSAELVLSAEVAAAAIHVAIATVKGEQMRVTCSWQDCVVDSGLGERLMGDLERWLNQIGSEHWSNHRGTLPWPNLEALRACDYLRYVDLQLVVSLINSHGARHFSKKLHSPLMRCTRLEFSYIQSLSFSPKQLLATSVTRSNGCIIHMLAGTILGSNESLAFSSVCIMRQVISCTMSIAATG